MRLRLGGCVSACSSGHKCSCPDGTTGVTKCLQTGFNICVCDGTAGPGGSGTAGSGTSGTGGTSAGKAGASGSTTTGGASGQAGAATAGQGGAAGTAGASAGMSGSGGAGTAGSGTGGSATMSTWSGACSCCYAGTGPGAPSCPSTSVAFVCPTTCPAPPPTLTPGPSGCTDAPAQGSGAGGQVAWSAFCCPEGNPGGPAPSTNTCGGP